MDWAFGFFNGIQDLLEGVSKLRERRVCFESADICLQGALIDGAYSLPSKPVFFAWRDGKRAIFMKRLDASLLTDFDLHLFNEGNHAHLYQKLGAHLMEVKGKKGTLFGVWAPDAERVSVMGDFNGWSKSSHRLKPRTQQKH